MNTDLTPNQIARKKRTELELSKDGDYMAGRRRFDAAIRQKGVDGVFKMQEQMEEKKKADRERLVSNQCAAIAKEVVFETRQSFGFSRSLSEYVAVCDCGSERRFVVRPTMWMCLTCRKTHQEG
jgi:hypothetical protein